MIGQADHSLSEQIDPAAPYPVRVAAGVQTFLDDDVENVVHAADHGQQFVGAEVALRPVADEAGDGLGRQIARGGSSSPTVNR